MVLWSSSDSLALYDEYIGPIEGLFSVDVVCGDWAVLDSNF